MKIHFKSVFVILFLTMSLASSNVYSAGKLEGGGAIMKISVASGVIDIGGTKFKFRTSTKVLNPDGTVRAGVAISDLGTKQGVVWKARKGPKYPILLWVKPLGN